MMSRKHVEETTVHSSIILAIRRMSKLAERRERHITGTKHWGFCTPLPFLTSLMEKDVLSLR